MTTETMEYGVLYEEAVAVQPMTSSSSDSGYRCNVRDLNVGLASDRVPFPVAAPVRVNNHLHDAIDSTCLQESAARPEREMQLVDDADYDILPCVAGDFDSFTMASDSSQK